MLQTLFAIPIIALGIIIAICLSLSSCMAGISTPSGIREFYRGQTGLVSTGKASPDVVDPYHGLQATYEVQKTERRLGRAAEAAESWGSK